MTTGGGQAGGDEAPRERLLRIMSGATFLVFFQAFMVAPLLPRFSRAFGVTPQEVGLIVPAYMVPYGVATLFYGVLSDRLGRRRIMLASLIAFGVLTALTATAQSATQLVLWRLATGLGEVGIGLALLGYGVPGFLLGPVIGRAADRRGRRWLIPAGLAVGAAGAAALIPDEPLLAAAAAVTVLSLGYDMTQTLLAGIVTDLGGTRTGQAMGLNVFTLFTGMGVGSLLFGEAMRAGFTPALTGFALVQLLAAVLAVPLFRSEHTRGATGPAVSA